MTMAQYIVRVKGTLDDSHILRQIRAIEKKGIHLNVAGANGTTGKGGKGSVLGDTAAIDKQNKKLKKNAQLVGAASKANKKFGSTTMDITKKVAQFGAVTAVIRGVTDGVTDMVRNVYELDGALTEFKKVSDLSGKGLSDYTDKAYEVGRTVAKTGTEMVQAATEFRKAGFNDKDSLELGRVASMYQNVADQEITAGEAANFIVSQMKAYNLTAQDSEHIIDAVNQVSNKYAVSSADIATNIGKASAAMATGNMTYEQSIGLMTAMTEITRNGAKSARGLVSIQSRYNQILDDSSSTGKKLTAWYKDHNIAIKDQNGQLKSFFEVGGEVAKQWDKLSDNEKKYYLNTQAGANQSQNLAALMRNYKTALEATATAENSAGSAAKENARYMESMEGKLQNLRSAWEKLSYKIIDSEVLKKAIDGLTKALDYLSSDAGMELIGVLKKLAIGFAAFKGITTIASAIGSFASAVGTAGAAAAGAEAGIAGLAGVFAGGGVAWGLLGAAGIVAGIIELNKAIDGITDPDDLYANTKKELAELKDKYKEVNDEIDQIKSKGDKATGAEQQRLAVLEEQKANLEEQIKLKEKLAEKQWEKKETSPQTKNKTVKTATSSKMAAVGKGSANIMGGVAESTAKAMNYTDELNAKMQDYKRTVTQTGEEYRKNRQISDDAMKNQKKGIEDVKKTQDEWIKHWGDVKKMPVDIYNAYKASKKLTNSYDKIVKTSEELAGNDWGSLTEKQVKDANKAFLNLGESIGVSVDESGKLESINYDTFVSSLQAAGYTAEQADDALKQLAQTEPDVKVNVDGVEVALDQVDQVNDFLKKLNGDDAEATVEINGVEYAVKDVGSVADYLRILNDTEASAEIKVDGGDEAKSEIQSIKNDNIPDKTVKVKGDNSGAKKSVKEANVLKVKEKTLTVKGKKDGSFTSTKSAYEGVHNKEVTITVKGNITESGRAAHTMAEHAQGTRHASNELAEVNEQGFEFIRDAKTGKLRIAGGGKRTVTKLNEGDIVYTHEESKRMMADSADIEIPQHASGSKKQKKYNAAREKIKDDYEKKKDKTEHQAKVRHWTDAQLQKKKEKDLKQYKKDVAKENKKWSGVKKKGVEREEKYEVSEGRADVNHDKWTRKIDKAIETLSNSGKRSTKSKEYKNAKKVINEAKKKKYISADERRDFLDEINNIISSNINSQADRIIQKALDNYENYGGSKEDVKKKIKEQLKAKHITKAERDEYMRQVDEIEKSLQSKEKQKNIESLIESVESGGSYNKAVKAIEKAYKAKQITQDEYNDYLKSVEEARKDYKKHIEERKLSGMMEGLSKGGALADTEKQIAAMKKQGLITAEEAEDYLKEARETAQEYKHEQATKAIETAMSSVRGTDADFAKIKQQIEKEAKAGSISAEEREQYLKEAYKQNLDYNMKLFQSNKKTYKDMRKTLEQYYKEGKLTAAEYYEYLDSLMQEQLAQQEKALEKMQTNNSNAYSLAQAYVNKQIKALQEDNEELDKQNELLELQANLEKAKSQKVKIYREGVGFVYEQNTEAIEEATKALQDFHKNEKSPELQKWEAISDLFGELEEEANMRDLEVRLGTSAKALVGGLGTDVAKWTAWIKNNLATGLGYTRIAEAMGELTTAEDIEKFLSGANNTLSQSYINSMINKNRFASGTLSAHGGLARVAENGYEIALLGKGDAVMPHGVSKNLMDWGQYSPRDFIEQNNGDVKQYNFEKLVLPNVNNAHDFIKELNRLPNQALQFSTGRV